MVVAILAVLLILAIVISFFLATQLVRVAKEKEKFRIRYHDLWVVNMDLEMDLSMERSLSTRTRRELEDAFANLEMVLDSEKFPGENSDQTLAEMGMDRNALYYDRSTGEHYHTEASGGIRDLIVTPQLASNPARR